MAKKKSAKGVKSATSGKSAKEKKRAQRPRGKPFVKNDPRINRLGVSKEKAELNQEIQKAAAAVLLAPCEEYEDKRSVLVAIMCAQAERALLGDTEAADFLFQKAGWNPKLEVGVRGNIVIDMPGPERERPK